MVRLPWRVIRIVHAVIVTLEKAHQEGEAEGREEEDEIMEKVRHLKQAGPWVVLDTRACGTAAFQFVQDLGVSKLTSLCDGCFRRRL